MIETHILTGLGLVMAFVALFVSGLNHELDFDAGLVSSAKLIFLLGLLLLIIDSLWQFRSKRYYHGTVELLAAILLFGCSFLPVYRYHSGVPGETAGRSHGHSIWAPRHVH
jgi:hypothetical protein